MNPTVTGALIAGGAALVGFAASAWQNSRTISASNKVAREQRLWDRKAAVYEEIFARIGRLRTSSLQPIWTKSSNRSEVSEPDCFCTPLTR